MQELKNKRTGIVLSGGGAKGIYQVGMFRALEEMGLNKEALLLAGTSIGAMNALQYACNDTGSMRSFIQGLGVTFDKFKEVGIRPGSIDIKERLAKEFMQEHYSDDSINGNKVPVTVCAYSSGHRKTEYFKLNSYPAEEQRMLTLASGSLPGILPPVKFRGNMLSDGGVPPALYKPDSHPDKIPVNAMIGENLDVLIICYLKPNDKVTVPEIKSRPRVYEIHPSRSLEKIPGMGTLDFRAPVLSENEALGYNDTMTYLS